ncbi:hypothetical protein BDP55DRAFT_568970 [Colletotrichum godetiae]|uniref:C2H2-type domain-containing protein n=1 Tax=Colletotrichum godetiae TaxID=1209918 RepID=A0AAJ0EPH2_9PEZI|nr:uncharacterized protein BDP55DRAFT_568970 [Colletotrichum godetiae]KAK1656614.1 hypothetical protein BDP55DRAFT_568970 [Colletotrichum godetiae]
MPRPIQQISSSLPRETLPPLKPQTSAGAWHQPSRASTAKVPRFLSADGPVSSPGPGVQTSIHAAPDRHGFLFPAVHRLPTFGHVLPALCPVTADGIVSQPDGNCPYGQGGVMLNGMDEVKRPIYAVGSQRRRGILSSAFGCPGVTVAGACNTKSTSNPVKNVGGKLPCPYCNTTYMRESHLKLYLLRHTCTLCGETFSLTDRLDNHFIRRRKPTCVVIHLSRPQIHVEKKAARRRAALSQNHGLNHSHDPGIMPADGTAQLFGMMPAPDGLSNHAYHRRQSLLSIRPDRLDDGRYQDGRHLTDSAIDASGQVGKMQKYNMPVQDDTFSKGGPDVDQQTGLDGIQFCHVHQTYEIRIRFPPIGVESIRGPCGQLSHRESLLSLIWKVLAAASLDDLIVFGSASQHHEEACETSSATEKYIQYLDQFDVFTGMSSIPHTAPEQLHLLCDSATEVYPKAQS